MWQLSADAQGTVALLRNEVLPIERPKPEQVTRLLNALDSEVFAERERATKALEKFGESVAAEMRQVLTQKPTLEVRRRIDGLLEKLQGVPHGKQLQALRAVEVLEHIATPEARTLLRQLAQGVPEARLTLEARQTLQHSEMNKTP